MPSTEASISGTLTGPRRPFCIVEVATGRFQYTDRIRPLGVDGVDGDASAAFDLRNQVTAPGVVLLPTSGMPHLLAGDGVEWPGGTEPTEFEPELDWHTVRATVFSEIGPHVEVAWPETDPTVTRSLETLWVELGPRARYDGLVGDTVIDLADGVPVRAPTAGITLRDDRPFMKDIARAAFEWYQTERAAFSFSYRQLINRFQVGQLITEIGDGATKQLVNTAVTAIQLDLVSGTTSIQTNFAEIDFARQSRL